MRQVAIGLIALVAGVFLAWATSSTPTFIEHRPWLAWAVGGVLTATSLLLEAGLVAVPTPREVPKSRDRRRFGLDEDAISSLPIARQLHVDEISYGEGAHRVRVADDLMPTVENDWRVTDQLLLLPLPHTFKVRGQKRWGRVVRVFVITDVAYLQVRSGLGLGSKFFSRCLLDQGGIIPFIDLTAFRKETAVAVRRLGARGAVVAVEFKRGKATARSLFITVIRQGVRYPDDVWISSKTGQPIASSTHANVARFALQSRQEKGSAADVFTMQIDGTKMVNLTRKERSSYDGFHRGADEVVVWEDRQHLRIASHDPTGPGVRVVEDPYA